MRILVYGFGPYRQYRENITEKILRTLPRSGGLKKIIFPVKFHRGQFVKAIRDYRPDIILGLGQCSTGARLRIEGRAINRRRNSQNEKARPIVRGGARTLSVNLELKLGRQGRSSANAGQYVCNYSMYVVLDFLKRRRPPARFGFIHVPHDHDPSRAARLLAKIIGKIKSGG